MTLIRAQNAGDAEGIPMSAEYDSEDPHALLPIRVQLYSVKVVCRCGWSSDTYESRQRSRAWAAAARHRAAAARHVMGAK